ncbi:MAG: M50 family metallopeptidase [Janthinobacterium lividum]
MPVAFRTRFTKALAWVFQIGLGALLGVGIGKWLVASPVPLPLVLLALVLFLTIAVHEAGHWLGSRYAGMRCYKISVLWLSLERRATGWHFRLGKNRLGALGYVIALPLGFDKLNRQMAFFIAGGPAASLLVGLPALGLGWWGRSSGAASFVFEGFWLFGIGSLLTGVLNLLPFTTRFGNVSDGERLRRLYRGGPAAEQHEAQLRLSAASYQGVRPRQWDAALLDKLLEAPAQSMQACLAHLFAYAHYLDAAALPTARQHLTCALKAGQAVSPLLRQHLYCEAAYLELVHGENSEADSAQNVAQWLAAAEKIKPFTKRDNHFTKAVASCSAGQWAEARQWLQVCTQETAKLCDLGGLQQGLDRIQELHTLIEQRATAVVQ